MMDKITALKVLHEISDSCNELISVASISIEHQNSQPPKIGEYFQILMKCNLDESARQYIKAIVEKHRLRLEETEDILIIGN
jgi:hypothetical protein